jgi:ADP-ribose pyrophosphatase
MVWPPPRHAVASRHSADNTDGRIMPREADKDVEIIQAPVVYKGYATIRRVHLRHRLHGGGWSREIDREMMERGHAVGVLPYDPARDEVVLVRQFRVGAWGAHDDPWLTETVGGLIEPNEAAADVARRETMEEAGCEVRELLRIGSYYASPGVLTERVELFCGIADTSGAGGIHGLDHEGEDIEALVLSFDDAWRQLEADRLPDAKAIICLQWLAMKREELRRRFERAESNT